MLPPRLTLPARHKITILFCAQDPGAEGMLSKRRVLGGRDDIKK